MNKLKILLLLTASAALAQTPAAYFPNGMFGGTLSYTGNHSIGSADITHIINMNCSSACTLTLSASPLKSDWYGVISTGSTVATVSLNSLNFNGGSTTPILSNNITYISSDGSNYFGGTYTGPATSGSGHTPRFNNTVGNLVRDGGQDVINVQDSAYGATGNGTTDDTAALNAAFAAAIALSGKVYIPGTCNGYLISSTLVVPPGLSIYGDGDMDGYAELGVSGICGGNGGPQTTIFTNTANIGVLMSVTQTTPQDGRTTEIVLQGFRLDCNAESGCTSMQIGGTTSEAYTTFIYLDHVWAYNYTTTGFLVREAWNITFNECRSSGVGDGLYLDPLTITNTIKINGGNYGPCTGSGCHGIRLGGATSANNTNVEISGAIVEGQQGSSIYVERCIQTLFVHNGYIDAASGQAAFDLSGDVQSTGGAYGTVLAGPITIEGNIIGGGTAIYSSAALLGGLNIIGNTSTASTGVNVASGYGTILLGSNIWNGGSVNVVSSSTQTICSGTLTLGTAQINSGAAASTVTATCTGLTANDNILVDFNSSPLSVTGWVPSATGMLTIIKWASSNTINVSVVNNTGSAITPGSALTLNYRVVR